MFGMRDTQQWKFKRLTDLAEYLNGYAFKPDDWGKEGLPIIRIEQLKNPESISDYYSGRIGEKNIIHDGDLIFSWSASLFLRIWQNGKAALNQHLFKVVEKEGIDRTFLKQFIEYYLPEITKASHGSTMQHITRKELDRFGAEFPINKPEQSKIAEVISTVDRAIEQTEGLIAKQQRIKTGLMQDILTRGIDEHGNLRSEETHEFKDSSLGRIPVEWDVKMLGDVAQVSSGITLGKTHSGPNIIEIPYLRVANVQDGFLDLSDVKTIRIPSYFFEKYELKVGDVLMNEGGDFDKLGRGTVWRGEIVQCLHQNHVFKVRPKKNELVPEFLANVSSSPYGKAFFVLASKQSTNLASINSTQLKAFPIPLPSYFEQKEIEKILSQNESRINLFQERLMKLRSLKTALMQDLLTGKVRVTPLLEKKEVQ